MARSAGGTHVVLPVPGGACSTTERLFASEVRIAGMMDSTGNTLAAPRYTMALSMRRVPPQYTASSTTVRPCVSTSTGLSVSGSTAST